MSREERFDREDFAARYPARTEGRPLEAARPSVSVAPPSRIWPIARAQVQRAGQSVLADRNGKGRPHKGIDIFAAAGTAVLSACEGEVLRVVDGRQGHTTSQQRAGLFVDIRGSAGWIYRYLHLGSARVQAGKKVACGDALGTVAPAYTSGLSEAPHLHFEIRQGDFDSRKKDYGRPVDPLRWLPPLRA